MAKESISKGKQISEQLFPQGSGFTKTLFAGDNPVPACRAFQQQNDAVLTTFKILPLILLASFFLPMYVVTALDPYSNLAISFSEDAVHLVGKQSSLSFSFLPVAPAFLPQ